MSNGQNQRPTAAKDFLEWLGFTSTPNWAVARSLGGVIGLVLCLLFLAAFVAAAAVIFGTIRDIFSTTARATPNLGAGALITALLGAPFLIWSTVIKHRALGFQKEGHLTDRISKAVEQLGAEKTVKVPKPDDSGSIETSLPNIEVRIGGVLSLERIAQDSVAYDKGRDHVRVMEILCAYVRENARAMNLEPSVPPFKNKIPRLDIQMVLHVIKRRAPEQIQLEESVRYRLDLRSTDLDGCDLSRGDFSGAIFWRSRLEAANLSNTNLTGTQMQGCLINFAKFWDATLKGTSFDFAKFSLPTNSLEFGFTTGKVLGVTVAGADLSGVDYLGSDHTKVFGSKDTKLSFQLDERDALKGLNADLRKARRANDAALCTDLEQRIKASTFAHWFEHNASDLAYGRSLKAFIEANGLIGWPHDD
ncbi:MAG: pentapeptide repeat-containing protein [Pseudomonadota bacterium]